MQKTDYRQGRMNRYFLVCVLCSVLCVLSLLSACAATLELPSHPPKYVHKEVKAAPPSANSLWHNSSSLFEDIKARRLNDLVTIKVAENITGSGKADITTGRNSSADYGVTDFWGVKNAFSPILTGSGISDFEAGGDTSRKGKLAGTITAKVVEVMPNGNLVLESRKEITINNEKQIFILRGMIRPDDIAVDNTVLSSKVADTEIYFVGEGVLQEKQRQGWLVRILDNVWPF